MGFVTDMNTQLAQKSCRVHPSIGCYLTRSVDGDGEGRDPGHAVQVRHLRGSGLVQQLGVLQFLAQPLERGQRLVQRHGHRDLGKVLPDVLAQQVPQVDPLRVRLRNWKLLTTA